MNMNSLAKEIAEKETGKVEVSIAQIKEVLRLLALKFYEDRETHYKFSEYSMKIGKKAEKDNV